MTKRTVDNVRVRDLRPLTAPGILRDKLPCTPEIVTRVTDTREGIGRILTGEDSRFLVLVGPCSIHARDSALEYAERLQTLSEEIGDRLLILMRVYFEKPRTVVGWKGLINDPHLNGTNDIEEGLERAREILVRINEMGLSCATETLDPITVQYLSDLVSWTAIGARTTESQTHRQMASGLSMPVGFKNSTDGNIQLAINAMCSAAEPHSFLGIDHQGLTCVVETMGNMATHVILRGGTGGPNFDAGSIAKAEDCFRNSGLEPRIVVDCSHANAGEFSLQPAVFDNVINQRVSGNTNLIGVMLESHLFEGRQEVSADSSMLRHGVSITDPCISWSATEGILRRAHELLS